MPDSNTRRIYLHLDEFGSLQRLPTLINLLTKGRSKGACSFLGIQDDGQMEQIYTENLRKSIDNACGNRITFGLSGETAERESKYNIGPSEYYETSRSMSMGPHTMRDGVSLQKSKKTAPLFLPSDISNIEDLKAIVRLKNYDFTLSQWQYRPARQVHPPFVLREDLILENILADIHNTQKNIDKRIDKIIENADYDAIEN
jgi:type IV secretory pathway TraG/TraD family ATPase VirD4